MNISNTNQQGDIVLNDCTLLELILHYPFIYNDKVSGFNDPDYLKWAWQNICSAYVMTYTVLPEQFHKELLYNSLQNRWQVLKSIIKCIQELYNADSLPYVFKQLIQRLNTPVMNTEECANKKSLGNLQQLLINKIPCVRQLSHSKKLCLEQKFLQRVLKLEIKAKNNSLLIPNRTNINQEVNNFLGAIGFNKMYEFLEIEKQRKSLFVNRSNVNDENCSEHNNDVENNHLDDRNYFNTINICKVTIEEDNRPMRKVDDNNQYHNDLKSMDKNINNNHPMNISNNNISNLPNYETNGESICNYKEQNIHNNINKNFDTNKMPFRNYDNQMNNLQISTKTTKDSGDCVESNHFMISANGIFQNKIQRRILTKSCSISFAETSPLKPCQVRLKRLKMTHYISNL